MESSLSTDDSESSRCLLSWPGVQCACDEPSLRTQLQTCPLFPPAEHILFVETRDYPETWKGWPYGPEGATSYKDAEGGVAGSWHSWGQRLGLPSVCAGLKEDVGWGLGFHSKAATRLHVHNKMKQVSTETRAKTQKERVEKIRRVKFYNDLLALRKLRWVDKPWNITNIRIT